jgi:hypothetical protein
LHVDAERKVASIRRLRLRFAGALFKREMTMHNIWIVHISHQHGDGFALFGNQKAAFDDVVAYVDEWWEEELGDEPLPDDAMRRVTRYFEKVGDRESFTISEFQLPEGFYYLNEREQCTVLAALQFWQRALLDDPMGTHPEQVIASDRGELRALDVGEITKLCQRISI